MWGTPVSFPTGLERETFCSTRFHERMGRHIRLDRVHIGELGREYLMCAGCEMATVIRGTPSPYAKCKRMLLRYTNIQAIWSYVGSRDVERESNRGGLTKAPLALAYPRVRSPVAQFSQTAVLLQPLLLSPTGRRALRPNHGSSTWRKRTL